MPDAPYQVVLFDVPASERITHWFYATTNSVVYKVGYAKNVTNRMKTDRQFKGHRLIWKKPCNCPLRSINGKPKCEREIDWEKLHAADRLPESEQYRASAHGMASLRWLAGDDAKAIAVLGWLDQHRMGDTA